ncbi:MAG TPA: ATP-binding protein, partial [Humisphaera sp.]
DLFDRAKALPAADAAAGGGATAGVNAAAAAADADPGPPPLTREIRLNRDGQWLTFQAVAKRTAGGGVLLVLRDVTALASAVQMKTDFVANASHELRTPIAAIKIAFETLREVYGDDAHQSDRCMQVIEGHLKRLEEMLRDLLDLSRVENPNLKPHVRTLKTADVLAHVRSSLGPMARQKLVELRLGEGLAPDAGPSAESPAEFLGDERLLNLILKNLIENSVKFTPAGGTVSVTFTRAAGDAGGGDGGVPPPVTLTVADTGIGIPPEHMDRVFERFYQVDAARSGSAGRGTGLGLAIVKHAINALGGQVELESEVGHGTTVRCVLPQAQPEPVAEVEEVGV